MTGASGDRVSVRAQAWELRAWPHSAFLPGDTHPCISLLPSARWPHLWIPAHKSTFHQEEGAAARPLRAGCSVLGSQICANAPSPNKPCQPSHSLGGPLLLALPSSVSSDEALFAVLSSSACSLGPRGEWLSEKLLWQPHPCTSASLWLILVEFSPPGGMLGAEQFSFSHQVSRSSGVSMLPGRTKRGLQSLQMRCPPVPRLSASRFKVITILR